MHSINTGCCGARETVGHITDGVRAGPVHCRPVRRPGLARKLASMTQLLILANLSLDDIMGISRKPSSSANYRRVGRI
eukprot:2175121-Pyramimonas_sp.AAC.1